MTWLKSIRRRVAGSTSAQQCAAVSDSVLDIAVRTDVGLLREHNEDSVLMVRPAEAGLLETRGILAIVADGMGGANAGEVASALACQAISELYFSAKGTPDQALSKAFQEANSRILDHARSQASCAGMGSTAVAVVVIGKLAWFAHIGDSRLYLVRTGKIYQMTQDDSLVASMVRDGLLTREQARHHEDRNILLRALGTNPQVVVTCSQEAFQCQWGDRFLLCSDGLHDLVTEEEMMATIEGSVSADAARILIEMANERGGHDNISAIVIGITVVSLDGSARKDLNHTREALTP